MKRSQCLKNNFRCIRWGCVWNKVTVFCAKLLWVEARLIPPGRRQPRNIYSLEIVRIYILQFLRKVIQLAPEWEESANQKILGTSVLSTNLPLASQMVLNFILEFPLWPHPPSPWRRACHFLFQGETFTLLLGALGSRMSWKYFFRKCKKLSALNTQHPTELGLWAS